MEAVDALAAGAADRLGEKPAPVTYARELRDQTDEREFALVRLGGGAAAVALGRTLNGIAGPLNVR